MTPYCQRKGVTALNRSSGTWAWLLQRFSAVLLVFLLGAHFIVLHFVPASADITFAGVAVRLKDALFIVVDFGLLILGVYHALNGTRNVLLDYWPKAARAINYSFVLIGIVAVVYGTQALAIFINGK